MGSQWNPEQYDKFKDQRAKPFYDLLGMIERKPIYSAVDLGCGTGGLTRILFDELLPVKLVGIDNSASMLASANKFAVKGLEFQTENIASYNPPELLDLIFTNAALQWLPNHEKLIPKLLSWLEPGGQFAMQVPFNYDHPSHRIASRLAFEMFPAIFPEEKDPVISALTVDRYAEILHANAFHDPRARVEVYGLALPSGRGVVEWVKGTLLTGYQTKLSEGEFLAFLGRYEHELLSEIGEGPYYYAFKRILVWGKKKRIG